MHNKKKQKWLQEIKVEAKRTGWSMESVKSSDWEAFWRDYGEDGLTPADALSEDLNSG